MSRRIQPNVSAATIFSDHWPTALGPGRLTTRHTHQKDQHSMAISSDRHQPSSHDRGPWWAAAGGGGGITAAVLQDHAIAWAIVVAFAAWLAHNVIIAWFRSRTSKRYERR